MSFLSKLTKEIFGGALGLTTNNTGLLQYPLDLTSTPKQQVIMFTAYTKLGDSVTPQTIYLPCPAGIGFSEKANFGSIDLGLIGQAAAQAAQTGDVLDGAANLVSQAGTMKAGQAAQIGSELTPFADQMQLGQRAISNPNTNTNFTGNDVRTFSFAFKMIAKSEAEAAAIKAIHSRFRYYTYAKPQTGENTFTLDYPPVWTIKFIDFETGNENRYIPAIFSCYLTGVTSNFNSSSNIFFRDGSPFEVDMSIEYQETRVLNRDDITKMEEGLMGEREIGNDGQPIMRSADTNKGKYTRKTPTVINWD